MTTTPQKDPKREKLVKRAAIAGAIAALLCQALPHDLRGPCTALVKVASLSCGAGG